MAIRNGSFCFLVIVLFACFAMASLGGCKAKAAKSAGFVDSADMKKDPSLPFHKYWQKPGFEWSAYSKIYVAPVNTEYMLKVTDWQKGERRKEIEQDVAKLGEYTRTSIQKAFRESKNNRVQILDAPSQDKDALNFEMALVEVVPSKVTLNALGYAPFFIGTTITVVRSMAKDHSSAAFEARIRDASTGEILVKMADREAEQVAAVSVRGLTWYSHAQKIISQWSGQFVRLANRKPGEKIKDTDTFTLQPW